MAKIGDVEVRECDDCGNVKQCAFQVSPYDQEINDVPADDENSAGWMCDDCYSEACQGI